MASVLLPRTTKVTPVQVKVPNSVRSSSVQSLPAINSFPHPQRHVLIVPKVSQLPPSTRINVLRPPTLPRRTVFLETAESQHHMHKRCLDMQRKEWLRQHSEWRKPMYGNKVDKELHRSHIRSTLKTQMDDREYTKRMNFSNALRESMMMYERERTEIMNDMEKRREKLRYLREYSNANKQMMESRWSEQRISRKRQNKNDSELLKMNPINWSHTLK